VLGALFVLLTTDPGMHVKAGCLGWTGHIDEMDDSEPPEIFTSCMPENIRCQGRPIPDGSVV
jgi:hypothetical protein